jgi:predicted transcriptional regulator
MWLVLRLKAMEVHLSPDLETKLARLAYERGSDSQSLVIELVTEGVERMGGYDEWFLAQIDAGLAQVEAGSTLSHEEVGARLESYLAHRTAGIEAGD